MSETVLQTMSRAGQRGRPAERRELRAGPLRVLYESGELRAISYGPYEILKRVYIAVRDRNWLTVPMTVSDLNVEQRDGSFELTFNATHRQREIDFRWRGVIRGDARGKLTFGMEGRAHSSFLRNRIGFCVLHPIDVCDGRACEVEKVDGAMEQGSFPSEIAPHQPFKLIRAVSHEVAPGLRASVRFEGDVFEMEDQRNWTDPSFKTYSTPLSLPFPVELRVGETVSQTVDLTLQGEAPTLNEPEDVVSTLTVTASRAPLPELGLGVRSHAEPLSQREIRRLRLLALSHLRVDLDLSESYIEKLRQAVEEAAALEVPLEVALHLSAGAAGELDELAARLAEFEPPVRRWLVFDRDTFVPNEVLLAAAREALTHVSGGASFVIGTNAHFAQLNRHRPDVTDADAVSYAITPQVHAFDNTSLMETLQGQAITVASARTFTGETPLVISPVTLKPRFLPTATGLEDEPPPGHLPQPVDVRQLSLFGVAWTLGSLKNLAESGVRSVTYYETTGWRGVMATEGPSPLPEAFPSLPGTVFPLFHVFADAAPFRGGEVLETLSNPQLRVEGLTLRKAGRLRLLLANLTNEPTCVHLPPFAGRAQLRFLDERNVLEAVRAPEAFQAQADEVVTLPLEGLRLKLFPYGLVRIDLHEEA